MAYGPTPENMAKVFAKVKEKEDGCYRMLGISYRVRNKKMTHYAHSGKILEPFGHFDVQVGSYEDKYIDSALKALKLIK